MCLKDDGARLLHSQVVAVGLMIPIGVAAGNNVSLLKPLDRGLHLDYGRKDPLCRLLWRMHYIIQVPMYFIKWPLALLGGLLCVIFWRAPKTDEDVVACVEGTSMVTVLHRDFAMEAHTSSTNSPGFPLEERHYVIDVKDCRLEHVLYESGNLLGSHGERATRFQVTSWSMRYTKSRTAAKGDRSAPWTSRINSFMINDEHVTEPQRMYSFLHFYLVSSAHTKSHIFGEALVERILSDDSLREKLSESTWTTAALHFGLLHGSLGPVTTVRHEGNKWMGIGSTFSREALVAESENMTPLGARHADARRWADLELPLSNFMIAARGVLRKTMKDHGVPLVLLEGIFLSCIMHAVDHVLYYRISWGIKFNMDFLAGETSTWQDYFESAAWRILWVAPTLNPLFNNKIRYLSKPFYRDLYKHLKNIDTLNIVDEITASIMY